MISNSMMARPRKTSKTIMVNQKRSSSS